MTITSYRLNLFFCRTLLVGLLFLACLASLSGCDDNNKNNSHTALFEDENTPQGIVLLPTTSVDIISAEGQLLANVSAEVAQTPKDRARGLMYRTKLKNNTGMLFVWDQRDYYRMWMKNTYISLDMLFIDGNTVVDIVERAKPNNIDILGPDMLIDKVLELPAGFVAANGITIGSKLNFSLENTPLHPNEAEPEHQPASV